MVAETLQCQNHNQDTILRQMLSVPENDISHIAHTQTVHENGTTGHMAGNFRFLLIQLQHISGMKDENVVLRMPKSAAISAWAFI